MYSGYDGILNYREIYEVALSIILNPRAQSLK
jgi:hypothetical protein